MVTGILEMEVAVSFSLFFEAQSAFLSAQHPSRSGGRGLALFSSDRCTSLPERGSTEGGAGKTAVEKGRVNILSAGW